MTPAGVLVAFALVALLSPMSACTSPCLSCACESDAECVTGAVCIDGVCSELPCETNDTEPGPCDVACNENDDCDALFVCDLNENVCVRDACDIDDDCAAHESARCDLELGFCVAAAG